MRITLRASGAMRSGPERDLADDYLRRAQGLARATGFLGVAEQEIAPRGQKRKMADKATETRALLDGIPDGAALILLDERGKTPTSRDIARHFSSLRDDGVQDCVLLIGPADGFDKALLPTLAKGATKWAFGPQTWPHKLLRAMAAEQIFRALSILAKTPYHRD